MRSLSKVRGSSSVARLPKGKVSETKVLKYQHLNHVLRLSYSLVAQTSNRGGRMVFENLSRQSRTVKTFERYCTES